MRSELDSHIETETKKEYLHKFFELDELQKEKLRERVEHFKGLVRIFVHPDFEKYAEFDRLKNQAPDATKLKKAEQIFQKILASQSEKVPPIFILMSSGDFDEFEEQEERLKELTSNDVYLIRTEMANSNPLSPERESSYRWPNLKITAQERTQMWEKLIAELKDLGIKKILIGGLELYISRSGEHGGCPGTVINKLQKSFDAELSTLTWPEGRKEIKK